MKRQHGLLPWICLLFLCAILQGQKISEKDLPPQYQEWLKLVSYIIQPIERDVFLKLTSDRDRDIFIDTFWKQRDPTPGTPENEYKEEHVKRFTYANKFYGRGTTREGWRTDMGRIYIILGPPSSIERFEATGWVVPCQAWSFNGDPAKDLPPHFVLLFFQRGGIGEYKLYSPVSDGPAALLMDKRDIDPYDYEELYDRIRNLAPTLADISISIVPGEYNFDYTPSTRNAVILANIFESPKRDVNPSYATHFLDYKGIVSTEYMTNFVESESNIALIVDPATGIPFVHFSMVPKSMSIDYYEPKDQYYCNFRLDVSLREGEDIIFQYNRDFPIYFQEPDVARFQANGISIEDSFPAVPGKHRLIILLQNSVGKEFSIYEQDIVIPEDTGLPKLNGPFLGYKLENYGAQLHIPYKVQDRKLVVDPINTFGLGENLFVLLNVINCPRELWSAGEVKARIKGMRNVDPAERSFVMRLGDNAFNRVISLAHSVPLSELVPDYYELWVSLVDGDGRTLDEARANFVVSPDKALPHPIANAKGMPLSSRHLFYHMLARQNDKLNRNEQADAEYRQALALAPQYAEAAVDYANFLLKVGKYGQALQVIGRVKDDGKFRFEYFLIMGNALMGTGNYNEAINSFLEGNKIYNSDTRLLNSLGLCYLRTGEKSKALDTFNASLRLNPGQDDIKKLVEEIEKD